MKKDVGHFYDYPENFIPRYVLGGYTIADDGECIYLCGATQFNLTKSPIEVAGMSPLTKEHAEKELTKEPEEIGHFVNLKEDLVYYIVTYGKRGYVFEKFDEAIQFFGIIVQFKAKSLQLLIEEQKKEGK